MFLKFLNII